MDIVGAVIICTLLLAFSIALFFMSLTKTEVKYNFFFYMTTIFLWNWNDAFYLRNLVLYV